MPKDLDLLQGAWTVKALEVEGEKMPPATLADARIVIQGDRFTSTGMGAVYEGTLELNTRTSPRQLNMKFDRGPEKGNTNLCIYELDGDTWKLCIATRGTVRPSRFASKAGSGFAFETLTRGDAPRKAKSRSTKNAAPAPPSNAPATEFEGEWRMISGIMNGVPMEESLLKWVKRVTQGNLTTVVAGPQVMLKVEFTHDSSKSPKTIDYLNQAGSHKGKTQLGIYQVEDGLLRICVAAPGAARPKKFHSAPGDGSTLTEWKRV
jgi:uncharacterized protein (TIGR03067 family)